MSNLYYQDSLVKECARLPVEEQAQHTIQAAYDSHTTLHECSRSDAPVSVGYLEAIAKARYALSVVAEILSNNQVDKDLFHIASAICTDRKVNTIGKADTTGPVVYLLKLLVRQFGFPCLKRVSQTHPWIVPQELKRGDDVSLIRTQLVIETFKSYSVSLLVCSLYAYLSLMLIVLLTMQEQQAIDPFVIYQQPYVTLRDAVNTAAYTKEVENLTTDVQVSLKNFCSLCVHFHVFNSFDACAVSQEIIFVAWLYLILLFG